MSLSTCISLFQELGHISQKHKRHKHRKFSQSKWKIHDFNLLKNIIKHFVSRDILFHWCFFLKVTQKTVTLSWIPSQCQSLIYYCVPCVTHIILFDCQNQISYDKTNKQKKSLVHLPSVGCLSQFENKIFKKFLRIKFTIKNNKKKYVDSEIYE
jgi:hypothetical protein